MTYAQKEERCKSCYHYNESSNWCWPCDACVGAVATLVNPTKDYFRIRKECEKVVLGKEKNDGRNIYYL